MRNFEDDRTLADEEYGETVNTEKKTERKKQVSDKSQSGKRTEGRSTRKVPVHAVEQSARGEKFIHQFMPYFLIGLALFTAICFLMIDVFQMLKRNTVWVSSDAVSAIFSAEFLALRRSLCLPFLRCWH